MTYWRKFSGKRGHSKNSRLLSIVENVWKKEMVEIEALDEGEVVDGNRVLEDFFPKLKKKFQRAWAVE